jgi:uncharacterized protein (DUF1015 family)
LLQATPIKEEMHPNGSIHRISKIEGFPQIRKINRPLCLADGHHRLSALSKLKKKEGMAAIFSADQVTTRAKSIILQIKKEQFWKTLLETFDVAPIANAILPNSECQFAMLFQNQWYQISLKLSHPREKGFENLLGIEIFRETVLRPIFEISTYTGTPHAQFYFPECSSSFLIQRIKQEEEVGFVVSADPFAKVIQAAKANRILEPNSTYFEPKLMSGLIHFNLET